MEEIFFSTSVSEQCFLSEACGKQVSGKRRLLGTDNSSSSSNRNKNSEWRSSSKIKLKGV